MTTQKLIGRKRRKYSERNTKLADREDLNANVRRTDVHINLTINCISLQKEQLVPMYVLLDKASLISLKYFDHYYSYIIHCYTSMNFSYKQYLIAIFQLEVAWYFSILNIFRILEYWNSGKRKIDSSNIINVSLNIVYSMNVKRAYQL